MHTLLTQPLNSNGDGADGEEYQRTLDNQGAAEAYLQEYQALLADRREAVHSERTVLAAHQAKEKKSRSARLLVTKPAFLRDEEELPETQVLRREMQLERKGILLSLDGHAIKTVTESLASILYKLTRTLDCCRIDGDHERDPPTDRPGTGLFEDNHHCASRAHYCSRYAMTACVKFGIDHL